MNWIWGFIFAALWALAIQYVARLSVSRRSKDIPSTEDVQPVEKWEPHARKPEEIDMCKARYGCQSEKPR